MSRGSGNRRLEDMFDFARPSTQGGDLNKAV